MQDIIFSPVTVAELVDLIASKVEERINKVESPKTLQDRIVLQQASELLGLSRSAIYKLTMQEAIPHEKYGKRLVFSRRELELWMNERTVRKQSREEITTQHLAKVARKGMSK